MEKNRGRGVLGPLICVAALSLSGCGGSSASSQSSQYACATACYVSGVVSGLNGNEYVKLENNGGDQLTVAYNANDEFTFSSTQTAGSTYDVTVASHAPGIACSVSNGSGTLSSNVTDVAVSCGAGTERILHSFAGGTADGADPNAGLVLDGAGYLYGTTDGGGAKGLGTVFKLSRTGTETILYSFVGGTTDGANPLAGLSMDSAGNLYGTTEGGGADGLGTVFEISAGGAETLLHSFAGGTTDGANPVAGLIMDSAGNLYGTTEGGGADGLGTVFEISAGGTETLLHSFAGGATDGANPRSALVMDRFGDLLGTTYGGGTSGLGTVFEISAGGAESILHSFAGGTTDGANPYGGVVLGGDTLYGTTQNGSFEATQNGGASCVNSNGCGTVFGLGINSLPEYPTHSFAGGPADGEEPIGGLLMGSDGNLYGTTYTGGSNPDGAGTVFEISSTGETLLHSFAGGATDGAGPNGSLVMDSAGNLYGTTEYGGADGAGTVFQIN